MRVALLSICVFVLVFIFFTVIEQQRRVTDYRVHLIAGATTWWVFSCLVQAMPTPKFMGNRAYGIAYYVLNFMGANFFKGETK